MKHIAKVVDEQLAALDEGVTAVVEGDWIGGRVLELIREARARLWAELEDWPAQRIQCPHCRTVLRQVGKLGKAHMERCASATPEDRAFYAAKRRWPA